MASVPNVGLKTFIGGLQQNSGAWIGGSRPEGNNPHVGWKWLDNSPWSYENWYTYQPSSSVALCLMQYGNGSQLDNKWNDAHYAYTSGYVCEKHWSA